MALLDELTIRAKAGDGGDGVVRWLHLKGKEFSGPAGGNGGDGGDIYVRAVSDINVLARYRGAKEFRAENGAPGEGFGRDGRGGDDLYIDVPRGSLVRNQETGEQYELLEDGETRLILKGGRGGAGNRVFKSSVNRSPEEAMPGVAGEGAILSIELRLIADAGLVGLPNAGKTTLLNSLTGASGKVGSYAFTTLDPNLGAFYGYIVADIPGLIEGASAGKGLGAKFLRHISRTKLLVHCVSLESAEPWKDYETVRAELGAWDKELLEKPELIVLTKSDARDALEVQRVSDEFAAHGKQELAVVSALEDEALKKLSDLLSQKLERLKA